MNKSLVLALGAGAIVVLAILVFVFLKPNPAPQTQTQTQTPTSASNTTSLKSLMAQNTSQTCSFADTTAGTSGNVYISAGKFRGDFTSTVNGTTTASHMLSDGTTMSIWMDGQTSGFQMNVPDLEKFTSGSSAPKTVDVNKPVNYNCTPGTPDPSLFVLPSTVTFTNPAAIMNAMPTGGTTSGTPSNKCAACDSLSGTQKTQCLTALSCPQ